MLKLKALELENFKNVSHLILNFSELNLISGDNGSGKSSILQAIQYALTDSLPEKLSEYIKWGEDYFKIHLTFEHNGIPYDYKIRCSNTASKELTIGNEEYKNSDATKKMKEIIDPDLLLYSCFSEQGQSYSILVESPAERLKKFKTILGVDRLTNVIDYSKEEVKVKKSESESIDKEIKLIQSQKFSYLEEFELPDIEEVKQELEKLEKDKKEKEEFDLLKRDWETKNSAYQKVLSRKEELESLIELSKKKTFDLSVPDFDSSKYQEIIEQLRQEELSYEKHKLDLANYNSYIKQISSFESEIKSLNEKKSNIKITRLAPVHVSEDTLSEIRTSIQNYKVELTSIKNHIKLAKDGKCPTCGQDFNHSPEELERSAKTIEDSLQKLELDLASGVKLLKDYESKVSENQMNSKLLENYSSQIKEYTSKLESVSKVEPPIDKVFNMDYLKKELQELNSKKSEYEKVQSELEKNKLQVVRYESELQGLNSENPGDPPTPPRRFSFDSVKYEQLKKEVNVYDQKVEELKRIQEHNEKIKEQEKENARSVKDKESIYYKILGEQKDTEEARNILEKQFSGYLIEKGTTFIESQMNNFFQKCYNKYSVYFKQTENKKSIDFYYTDASSSKITSASLCSGFEKQLLSIAFRVALASITGLGFLILDEIDSDASDENSVSLYTNLLESKMFNQIVCITHKEETKNVLINNYYANQISLGDKK